MNDHDLTKGSHRRIESTSVEKSVHFLRGVDSRSGIALTNFYLVLASDIRGTNTCIVPGHPGMVLQSAISFSSLNTVAIACRKVFDHGAKGLTGAIFGKQNDTILEKHAVIWAKYSGHSIEDALQALRFLRTLFANCSKSLEMSRKSDALLCRRIGKVKEYANNTAAHLTLDSYHFHRVDLAHIVAALTLVAEIIRTFDRPDASPDYFDAIDYAAHQAALALFPDAPAVRLFEVTKARDLARACWQVPLDDGIEMLMTQLPNVLGVQ